MNDSLQRIYRRLPGPARTIVAGAHGRRLRRWRYGPDTDGLVAAALERDTWSADRWQDWIDARRREILDRARHVPHYRDLGPDPAAWGLVDKEMVRTDPHRFLADDVDTRAMYEEHTSGSTGTPLRLWWSRQTVQSWYALYEARARRWSGVSRHEPWGMLGGQLVVHAARRRPPFWVWNRGLHQLYLSSYHLAPATAAAYASALERRSVSHLVGYPSALAALAQFLVDQGRTVDGIEVVIANAEPVTDGQRAVVAEAFGAPLVETYGMAELAAAASACPAGQLHVWPEVGSIEIVDDELVATGLLNPDMPLIRYRTGDRLAAAPTWDHGCPCGRTLPTIGPIDGRADDVVITPDGRRLGRLDPVFKADIPIREAQIIQDRPDHLRVLVVPGPSFDAAARAGLERRLRDHVGALTVDIEETTHIERGPGGKFRAVVSTLTRLER